MDSLDILQGHQHIFTIAMYTDLRAIPKALYTPTLAFSTEWTSQMYSLKIVVDKTVASKAAKALHAPDCRDRGSRPEVLPYIAAEIACFVKTLPSVTELSVELEEATVNIGPKAMEEYVTYVAQASMTELDGDQSNVLRTTIVAGWIKNVVERVDIGSTVWESKLMVCWAE